ncbi:hypothetical protein [Streptomyces gobiensis]|uniref:hypothetical protein n=1 Tax=Streptomyces gobiensis TaxID=2875706 RepID=UPI001E5E7CE4|nr:hypothetical protein [Streptomyces gobiensis]UGY90777.1 hypothetical protein test1122_02900 [Streptomyces gobiensis]
MDTNRRDPLEDLVHWRGQLPELLHALRQHTAPACLAFGRGHAADALEKTITGQATPNQLTAWAQAIHLEEDVDIAEEDVDLLTQFLLEVSTPELFEPVTTETCQRWLHRMRVSSKPTGSS